jgi:hypothetical protein
LNCHRLVGDIKQTAIIKKRSADFDKDTFWQDQELYGHRHQHRLAAGVPRSRRRQRQGSASIVVPCHRVVGVNGALAGFNGGVETKAKLLAFERDQMCPITK